MTVKLPLMRHDLNRGPFRLAKGPGTMSSGQEMGEKLFHTPVKDKMAYNKLDNVRIVDVGTGVETAVKLFRGLPPGLARDIRYQEKKYVSGARMSDPAWQKFFDDIPETKARRQAARDQIRAKECVEMVALNAWTDY